MKTLTYQPLMSRPDHTIIMNYLKSGESRTLFNRYDVEEILAQVKNIQVVDEGVLPDDVVKLNSTVTIKDELQDKVIELTIVTPKQANIKMKKVSVMSPVGIALIGYRRGQKVVWEAPHGRKSFHIIDVNNEG